MSEDFLLKLSAIPQNVFNINLKTTVFGAKD